MIDPTSLICSITLQPKICHCWINAGPSGQLWPNNCQKYYCNTSSHACYHRARNFSCDRQKCKLKFVTGSLLADLKFADDTNVCFLGNSNNACGYGAISQHRIKQTHPNTTVRECLLCKASDMRQGHFLRNCSYQSVITGFWSVPDRFQTGAYVLGKRGLKLIFSSNI